MLPINEDLLGKLRAGWFDYLTGAPLDLASPEIRQSIARIALAAQRSRSTLRVSDDPGSLPWADLERADYSVGLHECYRRITALALAYATPGSELTGNRELAGEVLGALDFLAQQHYRPGRAGKIKLWWHREYGIPIELTHIMILLDDAMPAGLRSRTLDTIEHYLPDPRRFCPPLSTPESRPYATGANLVWAVTVHIVAGALAEKPAQVTVARQALEPLFTFVEHGDGFHPDGSFLQHQHHAYNGGYGKSLLTLLAPIASRLVGTPWALSSAQWELITRWVDDAYLPFLFHGAFFDMVRGREIARWYDEAHVVGHQALAAILELSEAAPEPAAQRWRQMIAEQLRTDTFLDFFGHAAPGPIRQAFVALGRNHRDEVADPDMTLCRVYPGMDRVLSRRSGHAYTISMFSERTATYECIGGTNPRGWFTAAGMTQFHSRDLAQYSGGYWATVDHDRLPGITRMVEQLPDAFAVGHRADPRHWAGGVTSADRAGKGSFGMAAMNFAFPAPDGEIGVAAKKSWFMFHGALICVGSNITVGAGATAETVVDNRRLTAAGQLLQLNDLQQPADAGMQVCRDDLRSIHLSHPETGAGIGYVFPDRGSIAVKTEERRDRWSTVDARSAAGDDPELSNTFLSIVLDHRGEPSAGYHYLVLAGADADTCTAVRDDYPYQLVQADEQAHVLRDRTEGLLGLVFWQDHPVTAAGVTASGPACVVMRSDDDVIEIAVSDPTQAATQDLTISFDVPASAQVVDCDPEAMINRSGSRWSLAVSGATSTGRAFRARLSTDGQ